MTLYKTDYSVVRETVQRIKEDNEKVALKLTTIIMLFPNQPFHMVRVNKCLQKKNLGMICHLFIFVKSTMILL